MSIQRFTCVIQYKPIHALDFCHELGRIRGAILFDTSFDITLFINLLNSEDEADLSAVVKMLEDGIDNRTVFVIPETSGSYNGGEPHTVDGFKEGEIRVLWNEYQLNFKDPSYADNKDFWQHVEQKQWYIAWRTETILRVVDIPVNIQVSDPVETDLTSSVVWDVTASWRSKNKPEVVLVAPISDFFVMETLFMYNFATKEYVREQVAALAAMFAFKTHEIENDETDVTLEPDSMYIFKARTEDLELSLGEKKEDKPNEYHLIIQFATPNEGETIPTITWPSGLLWATGFTPTFEGGATYEISILNGTAMFNEAKAPEAEEPVTQS